MNKKKILWKKKVWIKLFGYIIVFEIRSFAQHTQSINWFLLRMFSFAIHQINSLKSECTGKSWCWWKYIHTQTQNCATSTFQNEWMLYVFMGMCNCWAGYLALFVITLLLLFLYSHTTNNKWQCKPPSFYSFVDIPKCGFPKKKKTKQSIWNIWMVSIRWIAMFFLYMVSLNTKSNCHSIASNIPMLSLNFIEIEDENTCKNKQITICKL